MTCGDVQARLPGIIDGHAEPSQSISAHLRTCGACQDALTAQQSLHARLVESAGRIPKWTVADAVMEKLSAANAAVRIESTRRPLWPRRVGLVAAAALITIILGLLPWQSDRRGSTQAALAHVSQSVQRTQSVAFKLRMEVGGKTVMSGELIDTRDKMRIVEGDGRIGIGDRRENRAIAIDPAARTFQFLSPLPDLPDIYGIIRGLKPKGTAAIEQRIYDDRTVVAFHAKALDGDAEVLVDTETHLPVRLEWSKESTLPDGTLARGTIIADDFVWDTVIDDSRLDMTPPVGFTGLPEGPPVRAAPSDTDTLSLEARVRRILLGCIQYGNTHDGCWPDNLRDTEPVLPVGILKHPGQPQRDIGYAYIKPDGRTTWESPARRRLVVYEQFDAWPGSVVVGFSDSNAERITDSARFDELLADAKRRAGRPGSPTPMENRINSIVYACLLYAEAHNEQWPEELSQATPYLFANKLNHPDRPNDAIGFEYVRPRRPAVWARANEKQLIIHERFDKWPGQVVAGFTDGSTELITDPARLERLAAEARRAAAP